MSNAKPGSPSFPNNFCFLIFYHQSTVTHEICCPPTSVKNQASLSVKTRVSTEVICLSTMPVVKPCSEVKARRLPHGNPAVMYTSSLSSCQGTKGCLGEAHITLQRTGSITARFAACQQGRNLAFVSHPPHPSSGRSALQSPTSAHMCLSGSRTYTRDGSPQRGARHQHPARGM